MKDIRQEWYDAANRVSVTLVDVTSAAQALASAHLCGPVAAKCLTETIAAAALLGAEMESTQETVSVQVKCSGPIGGIYAECTAAGTLRGYTETKILDGFDGLGAPDMRKVMGATRIQVVRSIPGKILSQGVSGSFDGYLAGSLQRKAAMLLEASVSDDVEILEARGLLVESMPDGNWSVHEGLAALCEPGRKMRAATLAVSPRTILRKLGLAGAEPKRETPLSFACRCSQERVDAMLAALPPEERAALPLEVSVTCHFCGRTWKGRRDGDVA